MTIVEKMELASLLLEEMGGLVAEDRKETVLGMSEFLKERVELEKARKSSKSKATKKKLSEFSEIEALILDVLKEGVLTTTSEVALLIASNHGVQFSTQKLTPRLKHLVKEEQLTQIKDKRGFSYYCLGEPLADILTEKGIE